MGEGGGIMDIGEGMCFGECCEVCKSVIHRPVPLGIKIYVYKKLKIKVRMAKINKSGNDRCW